MSQTENENGMVVVPVRVIEPIPPRGKMEVLQSKFGQVKVKRTTPTLLLPERFTRVHGLVFNNSSTEDLIIGSNESVAGFTGTRVPAGKSAEIRGPNPIYGTTDAAPGGVAMNDQGLIGTATRKTVLVSNPAAGADWSVTVPAGEFWHIQSLTATLATSAVVGNRAPRLEISDGVNRIDEIQPSTVQAASIAAQRWGMSPGGATPANSNGANVGGWGGPQPFLLSPGYILSTSTVNLDVGDQWSQIALDVWFTIIPFSADAITVSTLDEYLVPWTPKPNKASKRG